MRNAAGHPTHAVVDYRITQLTMPRPTDVRCDCNHNVHSDTAAVAERAPRDMTTSGHRKFVKEEAGQWRR